MLDAAGAARTRVVVIGGGFSGATFAILLMRDPHLDPCDITIVEPRAVLGGGIAYSAEDPLHRVNIAANRMAALPDDVEDFAAWIEQDGRLDRDPAAVYPKYGIFPARGLFGLYLDDLLRKTVAAAPHLNFRHIQATVQAATGTPNGYRLVCDSEETIETDLLVLATGHPRPRLPAPLSNLPPHRGLIVNPWLPGAAARIEPDDRVLIVGTGLTMGDTVASLRRQGHLAPLTAISRHGLTPRPRASTLDPIQNLSFTGLGSVSQVLRAIRREVRKAKADARTWSDVFDTARQQNSAIWTGWNVAEQRRFQRHLRPYWDVHRFQSAPQIHDLVADERASGQLTIFAASITKAAIDGGTIDVTLRRRGENTADTQAFDFILNCTGATGPLIDDSPVLTALAKAGLIQPDAFGSGIDVDALSHAKMPGSRWNESLFVLGPAIRGSLGEISGALEIATHIKAVTTSIVSHLRERQAPPS